MRENTLQLLSVKGDLPPLPEVLINLEKRVNDPNSDLESIAELVETDPVLSGRLIKLANSVLLGGGREKADDLSSAVMRLGLKMVLDLAYTLKLPNLFIKVRGFNQLQYWKHSFSVALLSQALAKKLNLEKEKQEVSYVAGLMHDLGVLVFFHVIPEEYGEFAKEVRSSKRPLEELENEKFGIGHPELGAQFIRENWPVSSMVIEAVEWHNHPVSKKRPPSQIHQIVVWAHRIASSSEINHEVTRYMEEPLSPEAMKLLGMDAEELEELVEKTREMVSHAEAILKG